MSELSSVLANRAWLRRDWPFRHVVARDVFTTPVYQGLEEQLQAFLDQGLSETPAPNRFSRNIPGYDSYAMGFSPAVPAPLATFVSPEWRDAISGLFDIGPTPFVFAGAHHHGVGSESGFVHNDFNPVWFLRSDDGAIRGPDPARCSYKTGAGSAPDSEKVEVVRGAALLFFLLNDGWRPGDGGETGFHLSGTAVADQPALRVPPLNNSLVTFECTPRSFHTFLRNTRLPRTSIIMWVHRSMDEAVARYGADRLERWKD